MVMYTKDILFLQYYDNIVVNYWSIFEKNPITLDQLNC